MKKQVDLNYDHLRKDPPTLFDVYVEVDGSDSEPHIRSVYPPDFNDERLLRSVCEFSFPTGTGTESDLPDDEDHAVQMFTFLLIDGQTCYTFGYCKYQPHSRVCTCILSGYSYTSLFYKLLNHLSMVERKCRDDLELVLANAYHIDVPGPHQMLQIVECKPQWHFRHPIPDLHSLASLNDDKLMLEFYNIMTEKQMITLYASVLMERRIVITGRKLGQLTSCCFALSKLLWPFSWQCLFSPIVPKHLSSMLGAPIPFIMGVPKAVYDGAGRELNLDEVVVADLDNKTIQTPFKDQTPSEVHNFLKHNLKLTSQMFTSDSFSRTFLRANVILFGKYRLGFVRDKETKLLTWDTDKFVDQSRPSIQPFLRTMLVENGSQYFDGFITERLKLANAGQMAFDEFEQEIQRFDRKEFSAVNSLQSNAPEVFQNAVSNVKDNASDVIGALKGKVQAISIRGKFGRLTPKNGRKSSKQKPRLDPLSVDASTFQAHSDSSDEPDPVESPSSQQSLDLIRFDDTPVREDNLSKSAPIDSLFRVALEGASVQSVNGQTAKANGHSSNGVKANGVKTNGLNVSGGSGKSGSVEAELDELDAFDPLKSTERQRPATTSSLNSSANSFAPSNSASPCSLASQPFRACSPQLAPPPPRSLPPPLNTNPFIQHSFVSPPPHKTAIPTNWEKFD